MKNLFLIMLSVALVACNDTPEYKERSNVIHTHQVVHISVDRELTEDSYEADIDGIDLKLLRTGKNQLSFMVPAGASGESTLAVGSIGDFNFYVKKTVIEDQRAINNQIVSSEKIFDQLKIEYKDAEMLSRFEAMANLRQKARDNWVALNDKNRNIVLAVLKANNITDDTDAIVNVANDVYPDERDQAIISKITENGAKIPVSCRDLSIGALVPCISKVITRATAEFNSMSLVLKLMPEKDLAPIVGGLKCMQMLNSALIVKETLNLAIVPELKIADEDTVFIYNEGKEIKPSLALRTPESKDMDLALFMSGFEVASPYILMDTPPAYSSILIPVETSASDYSFSVSSEEKVTLDTNSGIVMISPIKAGQAGLNFDLKVGVGRPMMTFTVPASVN